MRVLRTSSLEEYAAWYLERAARKGDYRSVPPRPEDRVQAMWQRHPGKMRDWFNASTRWHVVELDTIGDIANLVFLECQWTKAEGLVVPDRPNYRLLSRVTENAMAMEYLAHATDPRHKEYYDKLAAGNLQLRGEDRLAICSAEPSEVESNPAARYYLLDGVGRTLPYMILLRERRLEYTAIEAFRALKLDAKPIGTRNTANKLLCSGQIDRNTHSPAEACSESATSGM